jgi:hypothetical protein
MKLPVTMPGFREEAALKEKENRNETRPRPAFYAVIPADVRYDPALPQGAKLLYGEITALCSLKGFCWAGNAYFSGLYQKDGRTINRWIRALKDGGYISISFTFAPGSKEITGRRISLTGPKPDIPEPPPPERGGPNAPEPPPPPAPPEKDGSPAPPHGDGGGGDIFVTTPGQNCQGVVTFLSGGGDKNVRDIITSSNITKATAAKKTPAEKTEIPPPPETAEAEAAQNIQKLKDALAAADKTLVLSDDFYPRAAAFMAKNALDLSYVPWLHSLCLSKKPASPDGLFYKLFFADNIAAKFKAVTAAVTAARAPPPPAAVPCPACGASRPRGGPCPDCGLGPAAPEAEIEEWKRLLALPEYRREEFLRRKEALLAEGGGPFKDFERKTARLRALRGEFGLAPKEDSS